MPAKTPDIKPLPAIDLEQPHAAAFLGSLRRDRIPSLLFTGPEGTGKELAAIEFARTLCCREKTPCPPGNPRCDSCLKISVLEHPGIHLIYPTPTQGSGESEDGDVTDVAKVLEEKRRDVFARYRFTKKASIRIARARAVIQRANTKPFDSPYNVFIFVDAHAMREEAQNALLKIVEEPTPHSVVMFTTTNPEGILYTIRSRCQRIRFAPLKPAVIETVLRNYYGVDAKVAGRVSALSQGSILRAREMAESFDDTDRQAAAAFVAGISKEPGSWAISSAIEVGRGSNRESVARFLDEVAVMFRDVMAADKDLYINRDMAADLDKMVGRWDRSRLPGMIDRIASARAQILLANTNIDSTLADLFLALHRASR